MSQVSPNLKHRNRPIIRSYVSSVVAAYLAVVTLGNLPDFQQLIASQGQQDGAWRWLVPLASSALYLFLVRLIPTEWKEVLVFWRWNDRLPGHRAFSVFAPKEPRVNLKRLTELHGTLPTDGKEQNALWYQMSKRHGSASGVIDAHKSYLLYRDLAYMNLAVGIVLVIPGFLAGLLSLKFSVLLLVFSVAATIALSLNARNAARRFVQTVLAEESLLKSLD